MRGERGRDARRGERILRAGEAVREQGVGGWLTSRKLKTRRELHAERAWELDWSMRVIHACTRRVIQDARSWLLAASPSCRDQLRTLRRNLRYHFPVHPVMSRIGVLDQETGSLSKIRTRRKVNATYVRSDSPAAACGRRGLRHGESGAELSHP